MADDGDLHTYYTAVLSMLERIARAQKGGRNPSIRTSDVVQEVFLRLRPWIDRGESVEDLIPLAATAARRWVIDRARKGRPLSLPDEQITRLADGAIHSLRRNGIEVLDLAAFLRELDDRGRTVVDLRLFAGLEQREIIEVTGETEYFVRKTLKEARVALERLCHDDS